MDPFTNLYNQIPSGSNYCYVVFPVQILLFQILIICLGKQNQMATV